MKKHILKGIALLLAIILVVPVLPVGSGSMIVSAKAKHNPTISMTKKTIVGVGAIFTLNLDHVGANVKRMTWYTQNEKVATVEKTSDPLTGAVTTVGKGITNIRCKITYKDGTIVRPSCNVTVKIKATGIEINNAKDDVNNRQVIAVGGKYNFNRTLTPSNANDKTYWVIEEKGKEYATVNSSGIVTGIKPGVVRLTAVASLTAGGVKTSTIINAINIEIVDKTANVLSAVLSDATKLIVTFDSAINPSTIFDSNHKLLTSVIVVALLDIKGNTANALGNITGVLSTDGKALTITSTNAFNGTYGIRLSSDIKTTDNIALNEFNENLILNDTAKPQYINWTVNDTGLVVSLNFSEAMDFSELRVTDAKLVGSGQAALTTTINLLNTKANYISSADNKSLIIDLTTMSIADQNKMFSLNLSGIKDMSGNYPASIPILVYVKTDTTPKAQAQLISLLRTGYNTLTATFTRAIKTTGTVTLSGEYLQGIVDPNDTTKVNYTFSNTTALLSGTQEVIIQNWSSYNVSPTDTSSNNPIRRNVNFTTDKTIPILIKSVLAIESENGIDTPVLTLTYNKNISLISNIGSFSTSLVTINNDIYSNRILNYTAITEENQVRIILNNNQTSDNGTYTIAIPNGFVKDAYSNMSMAISINVVKNASVASALPAPKDILQSTENPSIINVFFDKKLDETTAEKVANYTITAIGTTIISAELTDNSVNGATVKLTLLQGSITATTLYPITITGITGYQNSYSPMEKYQKTILLNENKVPSLVTAKYSYPSTILLTFDEAIKATASFQVLQGIVDLASTSVVYGNTISISLKSIPTLNSVLYVLPTQYNSITDMNGNIATVGPRSVLTTIQ